MAPNCIAFSERWVLTIKSECLNRMICFGERALRRAIDEYVEHYNRASYCPSVLCGSRSLEIKTPLIGEWYPGATIAGPGSLDDPSCCVRLKLLAVKDPWTVSKRVLTVDLGAFHCQPQCT